MNSISVVVVPEVQQLPFEISGGAKRDLIQKLSPYDPAGIYATNLEFATDR